MLPQPASSSPQQPEVKAVFDQLRQKHRLEEPLQPPKPKRKVKCSKEYHAIMTSMRLAGHTWASIARTLDIEPKTLWSYIENSKAGRAMKENADSLLKTAIRDGALPTTSLSFDDRIKVLSQIASNTKEDSDTRIHAIRLITDLMRDKKPEEHSDDATIYRLVMEHMDGGKKPPPEKVPSKEEKEPKPSVPPPGPHPMPPQPPPPTPDGRSGLDELKAHFKTPAPDGTELSFGFDIQEDTQDDQAYKDTPA